MHLLRSSFFLSLSQLLHEPFLQVSFKVGEVDANACEIKKIYRVFLLYTKE